MHAHHANLHNTNHKYNAVCLCNWTYGMPSHVYCVTSCAGVQLLITLEVSSTGNTYAVSLTVVIFIFYIGGDTNRY